MTPHFSFPTRWLTAFLRASAVITALGTPCYAAAPNVCGTQGIPSDEWDTECGVVPGVSGVNFCNHRIEHDPKYTIWFFHGLADTECVFRSRLGLPPVCCNSMFSLKSYYQLEGGLRSADIVTISYGPSWLLTVPEPRTLSPTNATVDVFVNKIVPFIEGKYRLQGLHRVAMGHSMGGFNTATLCAAEPAMWLSCVLLNPMLLIRTCNPFDLDVCGSKKPLPTLGIKYLITKNFTLEDWGATQPFILLQKTNMLPKTFITACKDDDYGLFDGPKE